MYFISLSSSTSAPPCMRKESHTAAAILDEQAHAMGQGASSERPNSTSSKLGIPMLWPLDPGLTFSDEASMV